MIKKNNGTDGGLDGSKHLSFPEQLEVVERYFEGTKRLWLVQIREFVVLQATERIRENVLQGVQHFTSVQPQIEKHVIARRSINNERKALLQCLKQMQTNGTQQAQRVYAELESLVTDVWWNVGSLDLVLEEGHSFFHDILLKIQAELIQAQGEVQDMRKYNPKWVQNLDNKTFLLLGRVLVPFTQNRNFVGKVFECRDDEVRGSLVDEFFDEYFKEINLSEEETFQIKKGILSMFKLNTFGSNVSEYIQYLKGCLSQEFDDRNVPYKIQKGVVDDEESEPSVRVVDHCIYLKNLFDADVDSKIVVLGNFLKSVYPLGDVLDRFENREIEEYRQKVTRKFDVFGVAGHDVDALASQRINDLQSYSEKRLSQCPLSLKSIDANRITLQVSFVPVTVGVEETVYTGFSWRSSTSKIVFQENSFAHELRLHPVDLNRTIEIQIPWAKTTFQSIELERVEWVSQEYPKCSEFYKIVCANGEVYHLCVEEGVVTLTHPKTSQVGRCREKPGSMSLDFRSREF